MRVGLWRWLTFAAVLTPVVGVGVLAQPPGAAGKAPDESSSGAERARLQADLLLALKKLNASTAPMPYPPAPMPAPPKTKVDYGGATSIEPIREGMNHFRANDFEAARRTFQLIEPATLAPDDRVFVQYMLACSLRRQNKTADAEVIYREVANSKDDEFLTNCAIWQLSLIKSEQELQVQLEQLRSRAKSK